MRIEFHETGDPAITEKVLRSLPEWFGIEEAVQDYIRTSAELPMFVTYDEGKPIGFVSIKKHSPYSAEVYVLGVLPEFHRKGFGRALIKKAEERLAEDDVEYLQVKTVGEGRACEFYSKTRLFYRAYGFRPLEEFPDLWDPSTPCLLLVKSIEK